jgi:hypothetical protein
LIEKDFLFLATGKALYVYSLMDLSKEIQKVSLEND